MHPRAAFSGIDHSSVAKSTVPYPSFTVPFWWQVYEKFHNKSSQIMHPLYFFSTFSSQGCDLCSIVECLPPRNNSHLGRKVRSGVPGCLQDSCPQLRAAHSFSPQCADSIVLFFVLSHERAGGIPCTVSFCTSPLFSLGLSFLSWNKRGACYSCVSQLWLLIGIIWWRLKRHWCPSPTPKPFKSEHLG